MENVSEKKTTTEDGDGMFLRKAATYLTQATHRVRRGAVESGFVVVCLVPVQSQQVSVEGGAGRCVLQVQGDPVGTEPQRRVQGAVEPTQHVLGSASCLEAI